MCERLKVPRNARAGQLPHHSTPAPRAGVLSVRGPPGQVPGCSRPEPSTVCMCEHQPGQDLAFPGGLREKKERRKTKRLSTSLPKSKTDPSLQLFPIALRVSRMVEPTTEGEALGNAKLGASELLNESLVLRPNSSPLSCPRQHDPSRGSRGQILNRVSHPPSGFPHSSRQHQPSPAQGFHTLGFVGVPLAKPLC